MVESKSIILREPKNQDIADSLLEQYLDNSDDYRELALEGIKSMWNEHSKEKNSHFLNPEEELKLFQDIFAEKNYFNR